MKLSKGVGGNKRIRVATVKVLGGPLDQPTSEKRMGTIQAHRKGADAFLEPPRAAKVASLQCPPLLHKSKDFLLGWG